MISQQPATVAVTGAAGMLGREICDVAPPWATVVPLTRADADLAVSGRASSVLCDAAPELVVHCAAFTDVDGATERPEDARRGNVTVTRNVARACTDLGAALLHVSTEYVESSTAEPLNAYGRTKLEAEREAAAVGRHLIVRTQWLFGPGRRNFVEAILDVARQGRLLTVVQNEYGHPTYTPDLALGLWRLVEAVRTSAGESPEASAWGIYHLTNSGACSRLEFAQAALEEAGLGDTEITGIDSSEWPSPTRRPLHAVLDSERLDGLGIAPLRHWREALRDYVAILRERWAAEES
jgi:dTDP-4-dehydrorhamnose reductase